ncbi:MAG: glyceraldehyde 3-phosphate dehydrogenase NAD-binding domain-containing protein [Patescibacteria group bacterium]|nr:glyceraldehyde 3-phosphate dehydrogenase NAD-binding domain-containing protein [Patescibacteria group bacterium]
MEDSKKIRVAINGFGRIGRVFFRLACDNPEIEIVAINDLADKNNLNYLLKYDTPYQRCSSDCTERVKGVQFLNEPDPHHLPWKDLGIEVVVEATGVFNTYEKANSHIEAGAGRVVLTAPVKNEKDPSLETPDYGISGKTVLMGINEDELKTCQISANGSCTTNAVSPVLQILNQQIGVEKAILNTIHSYTSTQKLVDSPNKKDYRKGRAGAQNIIPTSTGAAIATTLVISELVGKFDGMAMRVPTVLGSIVDLTFVSKKDTTKEEVNLTLKKASQKENWKNVFSVTEEPVVSSDIIGNPYASIADLSLTKVIGGNLVKVLIWYDNEMGYARTLVKHVLKTNEKSPEVRPPEMGQN